MKNISMNEAKKTIKWKKPIMVMATVALLGTELFSVESPFTSLKVVHADSETYRVTASSLNVRSGSSPSTKSLGFVYKDQTLSVISQEANGWYKINFKGQTGYVSGAYVEKTGSSTNSNTDAPVGKKTIFIDPGHQRKGDLSKERVSPSSNETKYKVTYGASGVVTKKTEYQLTLETSLILKEELEKRGYHVMMTRTTNDVNISNIQRAQMANDANASLTVRVHADGSDDNSSVKGFSILTPENTQDTRGIYQDSLRASQTILNNVRDGGINIHGNGIFKRSDMTGFNWSKTPVVLLEIGFMSNPTEDRLLSDPVYQRRLMVLTADGISKYLPTKSETKREGWVFENNNWYYYVNNVLVTGWENVQGTWYYLNSNGAMLTGWQFIDGKWYYLNPVSDGSRGSMKTGWQFIDGKWYYLNPISDGSQGSMKTGWQFIDGKWYYLNPISDGSQGSMKTGWQFINGKWYYLNPISDGSRGSMKTGWQSIEGKQYYFSENGDWIENYK
ncbi:N-acetylmuramoyl-L-alanine amidase [Bacillus toyonensis]|uniref:N-acetylmuramoyl-L-alanine amidase n=1 Tax=Bacillus toyonensis TaxID=155322 RepID=UPI001C0E55A6|nr:N-acetylmuramoyl-L-alanine amidase [Bacillus toyonensis]MBU4643034.1 N-acetylmuramoyl-L-alanine amidase [Bacillus toyonensis]